MDATDSGPARRRAPQHAAEPPEPDFEWVFACNTTLGGVVPGGRATRFNGVRVPYTPASNLCGGARWCSSAWLAQDKGARGCLARLQGTVSRFGMFVRGRVTGGTVVVVPEDQLEAAAALAARSLRATATEETGPREWSMALVRGAARTRPAVRLDGGGDVRTRFAAELDVEWFIDFGEGHPNDCGRSVPDHCTVWRPDGTLAGELGGWVYLEDESVPAVLVDIAERYGNGLQQLGRPSAVIGIPTGSHRPLEPDEWDIDHDLRRWTT